MDEKITSVAEENRFITPKQVVNELHLPVSDDTIRRRLDEVGLYGRLAQSEYPFTHEHIRQRLSFAEGYGNWTEEDWERVLFSDETYIELGPHGQVWVQRPIGEALNPDYMTHKVPHPERVSLWGCFSAKEIGQAEIFVGEFDAVRYKDILSHNLLPTARALFPSGHWWLLHDNAPQHKSHLVQDWLFTHGVACIDFPPYSPDLNPIENLWADLKRRVESHHARTTQELEVHLKDEWEATSPTLLASLAHSMPARCAAVRANKGHHAGY